MGDWSNYPEIRSLSFQRYHAKPYPEAQPACRAPQLSPSVWQQAAFHNWSGKKILNLESLRLSKEAQKLKHQRNWKKKHFNNLEIHLKPWGCAPNWHSIRHCTGSNEWDLSFPVSSALVKVQLLWPEVDNNNLEFLFASLALWKNLYPEKCNCIDLNLVDDWNASILDI